MNISKTSVEFKDIDNYRVTYHKGSELIEIEEYVFKKTILSGYWYWKRIYMGFSSTIEISMKLFNQMKNENR